MKDKKISNIFKIITGVILIVIFTIGFIFITQKSICTPQGCTSLDTLGFLSNLATKTKRNIPKAYVVQSGSMEPAIKTGSLVITLPEESYFKDDIITFKKDSSNTLVTHRVYAKFYTEGIESPATYLTAGDANEDFDRWQITDKDIVGKVVYTIPYLGYLANVAKTPQGFILFVIVPSTIIIYEELKVLGSDLVKFIKEAVKRLKEGIIKKNEEYQLSSHNIGSSVYLKAAIIIPIFGAVLVIAGLASSFFFDEEDSLGNVFSAATSFLSPTPTPQPDGINSQEIVLRLDNIGATDQYGYNYDYANASVTFTYNTPVDDVLSGEIVATNLKPYATYQLKFEATPKCIDNVNGDDALNEKVGLQGRWWDNTDNKNLNSTPANNDAYYYANSTYYSGPDCITGYLVWDYITADSSGDVTKSVSTSNSYHVLWCGGGTCDSNGNGQLQNLGGSAPAFFPYCSASDVDGEIERSTCGGLILDPGDYHLNMILNEESFHQYDYGNWTAVMDSPIDFTIY